MIKIPKLHAEWPMQAFAAMVGEMSFNKVVDLLHESSLHASSSQEGNVYEEHSDDEQDEEEETTEE